MIELYSIRDAAKIFGQGESRLRYWMTSGFLWPSVRRGGQYFYTFDDLITIRTAVELLDSGLSVQKVRKALTELRKELPDDVQNVRVPVVHRVDDRQCVFPRDAHNGVAELAQGEEKESHVERRAHAPPSEALDMQHGPYSRYHE